MNRFGRQAQLAWRELAPTAYAAINDAENHFTQLGEQAEQAWADLWPQLAGPDIPGESMTDKVGRLNAARLAAEEMIGADWLTPSADEQEPDDGDEPHPLAAAYVNAYTQAAVAEGLRDPALDDEFKIG